MRKVSIITAIVMALTMVTASGAQADGPTCSDFFGAEDLIANHGQHIIGDYVTGVGHGALDWPPNGQVGGGGGAAVPGAAAAHGHFDMPGLAPGASFCTGRAAFTTPGPFLP